MGKDVLITLAGRRVLDQAQGPAGGQAEPPGSAHAGGLGRGLLTARSWPLHCPHCWERRASTEKKLGSPQVPRWAERTSPLVLPELGFQRELSAYTRHAPSLWLQGGRWEGLGGISLPLACSASQAKWDEARKVEKMGKPSDFSLLRVGVAAPSAPTSRTAIYSQRPCCLLARLGGFSS